MTSADIRRQRIEAKVAQEEAQDNLTALIVKLKTIGSRARRLSTLIDTIELSPPNPLQSESALLMLSPDAYDEIDFVTVRALANSIAAARKEVAGISTLNAAMGNRA
jgi:hypothetical protein